ncbi:hypothetical protein OGAPHI_005830 [Ogataea philodendri]|uniref:Uncharacterized protein n=1 Tax=Ogataea philodendri TaxID=1378263 RepID=A0A9P8NZ48_9ASCO|nr:uncharacterized protein OGAPHI_005830 [Ogataea philodendri]KAH3662578.1 hypothetical protein OGAPHI_005830 [Ogataea philodendri]
MSTNSFKIESSSLFSLLNQLGQQLRLESETGFVVRVGKNVKDVADDWEVEVLVESKSKRVGSQVFNVFQQLNTKSQTSVLDLSVVVLESPQNRIDKRLERLWWELNKSIESLQIDLSQQLVKLNSMFWILGEILIDHVQSNLKNVSKDKNNLVRTQWRANSHIGLDDVGNNFDNVRVGQQLRIFASLLNNGSPCNVRKIHQVRQKLVSGLSRVLCGYYGSTSLVKRVNLLGLKVRGSLLDVSDDFINERSRLTLLLNNKVTLALLSDLDKSVTCHILNSFVGFMHKFKQLIDNSLQELPVSFQESWVLSNNVHDVGCHNCLVILTPFHFGQRQQIFNNCNQESFLSLFVHRTRDRTDCPTQSVDIMPRPFRTIDLASKLGRHDCFCVIDIQVSKVNQNLSHRLVQLNGVTFLDKLSHNFSFIIFNNQHLFWSDHVFDHHNS